MAKKTDTGIPTVTSLFRSPPSSTSTEITPEQKEKKQKQTQSDAPEKVVTTVRVFPSTLAMMHAMKYIEKSRNNKAKFGDFLDEAIRDLFKKKGYDESVLHFFENPGQT